MITVGKVWDLLPEWETKGNATAYVGDPEATPVEHKGWLIWFEKHHGNILAVHITHEFHDLWLMMPTYLGFDCRDKVGILGAAMNAINRVEGGA